MRLFKYVWFVLVMFATGWLPDMRPTLRIRGLLLRPCFKSCGRNLKVARGVTISFSRRLEIGHNVYIATGCWIQARGGITIEDEVRLGPYVVLATGHRAREHGSYRFGASKLARIRLCHGCWVAAHATVTKGVTVGSGALVACNSVATRDVPEFTVAGGVPARVIQRKTRIEVLL
jgi:maltose O-acetyltransferase